MIDSFFPFAATTGSITVRVAVSYLPEQSHPALGRWFWAYHVRVENHGEVDRLPARPAAARDGDVDPKEDLFPRGDAVDARADHEVRVCLLGGFLLLGPAIAKGGVGLPEGDGWTLAARDDDNPERAGSNDSRDGKTSEKAQGEESPLPAT